MKVYLLSDYDPAVWYENIRLDCFECWYCGRQSFSVPGGWFGPWLIERAHIVANPRVEDRRAIIMLCSLCHRTQHGEQIVLNRTENIMPALSLAQMLWLKWTMDRNWFDLDFLTAHHIGRLPTMERPSRIPVGG